MQKPSCAFPKASLRRLQRMFTQNKRVSASNTPLLQSVQLQCKSWNLGGLYTLACERQLWERHKTNVRQAPKTVSWVYTKMQKQRGSETWRKTWHFGLNRQLSEGIAWKNLTGEDKQDFISQRRNFNDFHSSRSYHIHLNTYMGVRRLAPMVYI